MTLQLEAKIRPIECQSQLLDYCIHLLNLTPLTCPDSPPQRIKPGSFRQIHAVRDELAALRMAIYRPDDKQHQYLVDRSQNEDPGQRILDQYFDGVSYEEVDQRVVIDRDPYPAEMPKPTWPFTEVAHFNFWYPNEELPIPNLAQAITYWCNIQHIQADDFVLWRKPPVKDSYTKGLTRSVSLPHGHIVARLRNHELFSS